jgi:protein TonB
MASNTLFNGRDLPIPGRKTTRFGSRSRRRGRIEGSCPGAPVEDGMMSPARRFPSTCAVLLGLALLSGGWPASGEEKAAPAKAAPVLRLNVYFPADFADASYRKDAFERVLSSWKPKGPTPPAGKKTVVIARIGKDGTLVGLEFHLESGQASFDASALDAVKRASPFKPIPKGYPQSSLEVHWHFEVGG